MSYKIWRKWFNTRSIYFKWFILLVLFRPIIDIGNNTVLGDPILNLQEISGILTYIFLIISLVSIPPKKNQKSFFEIQIWLLVILFFISLLMHFVFNPDIYSLYILSKALFPFILFIYLKKAIKNATDVEGILTTALFATIFPAFILIYEIAFGPIFSHLSRGLIRYQGLYEDVFTYSFNLIIALIIFIYFYFKDIRANKKRSKILLYLLFLFSILITFRLNHNVTTITVIVIILYFLTQELKIKPALAMVSIFILLVFAVYFFASEFQDKFLTAINTEIGVIQGSAELGGAFHGRFNRWFYFFDKWQSYNFSAHLLGMPFSFTSYPRGMIFGQMHSDFVRILFSTGFIGLITYLLWFPAGFWLSKNFALHIKFLFRASLFVLFLFSVTTLPLLYAPLMYFTLPVFLLAISLGNHFRKKVQIKIKYSQHKTL